MNDLRHDPDAHTPDRRDPTWFAASDTATVHVIANPQATTAADGARLDGVTCVMPAESLRTVPMPDLRTPDAEARDLRTAGDKIAELQQQVSDLRLEVDELKRVQTVTIAGLEAYIRDHSEVEE